MNKKRDNEMAADVQLSFVQSLYTKRSTLFIGMLSHTLVATLSFYNTNQIAFLIFALGIVSIWMLRMLDMNRFDAADPSGFSAEKTYKWERRYVFGAVSISLLLGIMTAYAFAFSGSVFAQLATVTVTFATLVAVVGRNFGSKVNVDMMVLAVCLPVLVGFVFSEDIYVRFLALLLLPVFLSTRSLANGVRDFLYDAVMAQKESSVLAGRLDGAINNMSHGLIMVNANNDIRVINQKAKLMLGIAQSIDLSDRPFAAVLRYVMRNGAFASLRSREIRHEIFELIEGKKSRMQLEVDENCYLEFSARHQKDGGVVIIFEDVTSKVRSDERILHMARYDKLTNVPNREWFQQLIEQKLKTASPDDKVGLAVFDIIDFKHVNDTKGHTIGDFLLCAVAERLKSFAPDLIVSRFGGDEFVVFFHSRDGLEIDTAMEKLFDQVCGVYTIEGDELFINFAAGLNICSRADMRIENMHICADIALRDARRKGNNKWLLFASNMDEKYSERQKLKLDLREALKNDALTIAYQPMFSPDGMKVLGAEALSRWNHPELGPISPGIYIPLVEEIGIVRDLTRNMIMNATKDCAKWPDEMFVSVNLSAHDLIDGEIIKVISQAIIESGLDPRRLHLEVTESAVVDEPEQAASLLREMRQMGMSIAIDDFGTGYSSLSYLDKLPLNKVKIDRSFVKDIVDDERKLKLLRGIVNMSRELGLDIVTEGVETQEQLMLVRENDCADVIQGFIFGMPMPRSALQELARKLTGRSKPRSDYSSQRA